MGFKLEKEIITSDLKCYLQRELGASTFIFYLFEGFYISNIPTTNARGLSESQSCIRNIRSNPCKAFITGTEELT